MESTLLLKSVAKPTDLAQFRLSHRIFMSDFFVVYWNECSRPGVKVTQKILLHLLNLPHVKFHRAFAAEILTYFLTSKLLEREPLILFG